MKKDAARYGFDLRPYYPAFGHDIGSETQAARNNRFGFRAELYATAFTKRIQDWCTVHRDQEEVVNPVSVSSDLLNCFRPLEIPGIDKIGCDRPAERFHKVVSSAACNWDKAPVMSQTYGAMGGGLSDNAADTRTPSADRAGASGYGSAENAEVPEFSVGTEHDSGTNLAGDAIDVAAGPFYVDALFHRQGTAAEVVIAGFNLEQVGIGLAGGGDPGKGGPQCCSARQRTAGMGLT